MIKAIVFDMDDTLYPESEYVCSGFKAVSKYIEEKVNINDVYIKLISLFNENKEKVFDRFISFNNINLAAVDLHKEYIDHFPIIKPYNDVLLCLDELKKLNYKLGIITDGRAVQQRSKFEALSLEKYFDLVVFSDELGVEYRKPHQKPFECMKAGLKIEYSEMIYVGDNPKKDFYISVIYPIQTVQILRQGFYSCDYFCGVKPDYIISSLDELKYILIDKN